MQHADREIDRMRLRHLPALGGLTNTPDVALCSSTLMPELTSADVLVAQLPFVCRTSERVNLRRVPRV